MTGLDVRFAGMTGKATASRAHPRSRATLAEGGLQRGEVFAHADRRRMVRPEAFLKNCERADHQRFGFGDAVRLPKQKRKIVQGTRDL